MDTEATPLALSGFSAMRLALVELDADDAAAKILGVESPAEELATPTEVPEAFFVTLLEAVADASEMTFPLRSFVASSPALAELVDDTEPASPLIGVRPAAALEMA